MIKEINKGDAFTRKIQYLTFDLGVKVARNIAQYPLYHVTYAPAKLELAASNSLGGDALAAKKAHDLTFDLGLGFNVTRNVAQYPLYNVTYVPEKFEIATPNGLGEDTMFYKKREGRTDDGSTLVQN